MEKKFPLCLRILVYFFTVVFLAGSTALNAYAEESKQAAKTSQDAFSQASAVSKQDPGADWDPFQEMDEMQKNMTRIFKETSRRMRNNMGTGDFYEPDVDFTDKGEHYELAMDLPGMEKDKIKIEAKGNALTISGKRVLERKSESKDTGFYHFERSSGEFQRVIPVPEDAQLDSISAKYDNGVLLIAVPKKKLKEEVRSVAVQ